MIFFPPNLKLTIKTAKRVDGLDSFWLHEQYHLSFNEVGVDNGEGWAVNKHCPNKLLNKCWGTTWQHIISPCKFNILKMTHGFCAHGNMEGAKVGPRGAKWAKKGRRGISVPKPSPGSIIDTSNVLYRCVKIFLSLMLSFYTLLILCFLEALPLSDFFTALWGANAMNKRALCQCHHSSYRNKSTTSPKIKIQVWPNARVASWCSWWSPFIFPCALWECKVSCVYSTWRNYRGRGTGARAPQPRYVPPGALPPFRILKNRSPFNYSSVHRCMMSLEY